MSITELIGNAASGGILGFLGSISTGIVSIFQQKSQYAHEQAMGELELKRISAQSDAQSKLSADQLKAAMEQGANEAFKVSQISGNTFNTLPPPIAGALALWRPALTAALIVYSLYVYPACDAATKTFIVQSYVTAGSAAVLWWFGSRQMQRLAPGRPAA